MPSERAKEAVKAQHELMDSLNVDSIMRVLKATMTLPSYSLNNIMLLVAQRPDIAFVAGMRWYNRHNRYVKKGSHALYVYAPMLVKDKTDEEEKRKKLIFRLVPVFDYRDTDGEPIIGIEDDTSLPYDELDDDTTHALMYQLSLLTKNLLGPNALIFEDTGSANGVYYPKTKTISLHSGKPARVNLGTLVHELAHAYQHATYSEKDWKEGSRADKELVAEFVAFKTLALLGVNNERESANYIANWSLNPGRQDSWGAVIQKVDAITKQIITAIAGIVGDQSHEEPTTLHNPALSDAHVPAAA